MAGNSKQNLVNKKKMLLIVKGHLIIIMIIFYCQVKCKLFPLQAKINRWKDCETSLQRLRGEDSNVSEEAAEIRVILRSNSTEI